MTSKKILDSLCAASLAAVLLSPICGGAAPVQPVFTNDTVADTLTFNDTFGHQVVIGSYNPATGGWTDAAGAFSIGVTFTGGLLAVASSPCITPTCTIALTVAGTTGGVPYFSAGSTWASSASLLANRIVLGGGSGGPATSLGLGTTTQLLHGNAAGAPTWTAVTSADIATAVNSLSSNIQDTGGSQTVVDLATAVPANGTFLANAGAVYKNCPMIYASGNPNCTSPVVLQRSSTYLKTTTSQDASIAEYAVTLDANLNSGKAAQWAITTVYTAGTQIDTTAGAGNIYQETVASCTSAGSGNGPTGTGSGIADNTCLWNYIGSNYNAAKVGVFTSSSVGPLGTRAIWSTADDFVIQPGWTGIFAVTKEIDIQNQSSDCALFTAKSCYGLLLGGLVTNPLTAYVDIIGTGSLTAAHLGIWISGSHIDDTANIEISGVAPVAYCVGCVIQSAHTTAGFKEKSIATTSRAFSAEGTYALASFYDNAAASPIGLDLVAPYTSSAISVSTGPIALAITGTHSSASISDSATTPAALNLQGTYSLSAINIGTTTDALTVASGDAICMSGTTMCFKWNTTSTAIDFSTQGIEVQQIANGSVATVLGSLGPVGSHTAVQEWFQIKDSAGTIRYVPGF